MTGTVFVIGSSLFSYSILIRRPKLQPPTVSTTPGATSSGSNTASGATSSGRLPRLAKLAKRQTTQQDDESNQSSIAKHLIENPRCAESYHPEQFKIVAFARTNFHLKVPEAVFFSFFETCPMQAKDVRLCVYVVLVASNF